MLTIILVLAGIVVLIAGAVVLYFRGRTLAKTRLMRETVTSPASDVSDMQPGTVVEVKGTLRCDAPLESEMEGETCAYYISQVIREYEESDRDSDGDRTTQRRSEVLASHERFAPFSVEDDSGVVEVRGEDAEVDALEVVDRFERGTGGGYGTFQLGSVTLDLGGGDRTIGYRYVEKILKIGVPVYILGTVDDSGGISAKSGNRFIISYRSEEDLEKKYSRDALILALAAAGLGVLGLLLVVIGIFV